MVTANDCPRLRPLDAFLVPDRGRSGHLLVLRDPEGITKATATLPAPLGAIVQRFDGSASCRAIAAQATEDLGVEVEVGLVLELAEKLDEGLFLDSPRFHEARRSILEGFRKTSVRKAAHAGGAYSADPDELRDYITTQCLHRAAPSAPPQGRLVAIVAPHIDPWRGALGYGHAYRALSASLSDEADTFVLLGTSHAVMEEPFALCKKSFETPLGLLDVDEEAVDTLAKAAGFDVYADELNHRTEHSLEFQAVFLRHALGNRKARIVPILAGLGDHQRHGKEPNNDKAHRFLEALTKWLKPRRERTVLVAGADLAHVGPRFGDARPLDEGGRRNLDGRDRASLDHALRGDATAFWTHVHEDLEARRVCGLAPIYTLLRALPEQPLGEVLHYEQTVDPDDGSIVSHAAMRFWC